MWDLKLNTIFATSARPVRRVVLAILLALCLVPLMLTGTAHAAQAPTACNSRITHLTAITIYNHQTAYISGQCLGTYVAYKGKDTYYFYIHVYDGTAYGWNACYVGDTVTCSIQSWGQNEIIFKGFAGQYGQYGFALYQGEPLAIEERNPEYPAQWWTCIVYVGYPANC
jgi:hypothetical protein